MQVPAFVPLLKEGTEGSILFTVDGTDSTDSLRKNRLTAGGVRLEKDFSRSML